MTTTVTMLQTRLGESGSLWTVGNSYAASDAFAAMLITSNLATGTLPKSRSLVPLWGQTDSTGAVASVVDGAGKSFLRGALVSGDWVTVPSIFRLRLTGTGTAVMDSRDSLGVVTPAVASYTVSGATDQIEFPYAGDNAVAIRVTLTGTAAAEVI